MKDKRLETLQSYNNMVEDGLDVAELKELLPKVKKVRVRPYYLVDSDEDYELQLHGLKKTLIECITDMLEESK